MDPSYANERAEIVKLAAASDAQSLELLKGYVREAQRECALILIASGTVLIVNFLRSRAAGKRLR